MPRETSHTVTVRPLTDAERDSTVAGYYVARDQILEYVAGLIADIPKEYTAGDLGAVQAGAKHALEAVVRYVEAM